MIGLVVQELQRKLQKEAGRPRSIKGQGVRDARAQGWDCYVGCKR